MKDLLLFDIDGTLLSSGGAGFRAFDRVFQELYGVDIQANSFDVRGTTDLLMLRGLYKSFFKKEISELEVQNFFNLYSEVFDDCINDNFKVHKGVREALSFFKDSNKYYLAIITGNIERTLKIKLEYPKIDHFFEFYFSSDISHIRSEIVATAIGRVKEEKDFTGKSFLIGDAKQDLIAAKDNNSKSILIKNDNHNLDSSLIKKADLFIESFLELEKLKRFLD